MWNVEFRYACTASDALEAQVELRIENFARFEVAVAETATLRSAVGAIIKRALPARSGAQGETRVPPGWYRDGPARP